MQKLQVEYLENGVLAELNSCTLLDSEYSCEFGRDLGG